MPDILPVSVQDILYRWQSDLRKQVIKIWLGFVAERFCSGKARGLLLWLSSFVALLQLRRSKRDTSV